MIHINPLTLYLQFTTASKNATVKVCLFFAKQPFHWQLLRLEFALKLSHVKVCPYGTRRLLTKHYIVEHVIQIAYTME
ncbi:hypothetical protein, partial [Vibrio cholerae]|uniref:hypothetical protein n=1 Tax=Vibrio cholerae TaxID=666 RepID=UPI0039C9F98A